MRKQDGHVTVTTKEARSGETSGHVRIILIAGMALAIIGLIIVLAVWSQG
jgi:hypothetical protein